MLMRVALVHDWITGMRGGERCLAEFLALYPEADIYTLVHEPGTTTQAIDERVRGTSWLQKFPRLRKRYRLFLPLFPLLARSIRLRNYDLVISLSHAVAKNVSCHNVAYHICYCFTPMRYIWDMAPFYLGKTVATLCAPLIWTLRQWDRNGARRVNQFVGISHFIAARIRKYYGRRAHVLYPPVVEQWEGETREIEQSTHPSQNVEPSQRKEAGYFLYAGAFVPYKGVEHIIQAFNELNLPLLCVGSGPLESSLRKKAGEKISFLSGVSDEQLGALYRNARALIFPAKEDFGIIPIEALLSGIPVIAGYHGATRETVPGWRWWLGEKWDPASHAGIFFPLRKKARLQGESVYPRLIAEAVEKFVSVEDTVRRETAIKAGKKFSLSVFQEGWLRILEHEGLASPADGKVVDVQAVDMQGVATGRSNAVPVSNQKRRSTDAEHHVGVEGDTGEVATGC